MNENIPLPKYKIGDIVVINRKSGTEHKAAQAKIIKAIYGLDDKPVWQYYLEIYSLRTKSTEMEIQPYTETEILFKA